MLVIVLTADECKCVIVTVQLSFILDIQNSFCSHFSGKNLFLEMKETFACLELGWEKSTSVRTDCGRNLSLRLAQWEESARTLCTVHEI